MGQAVHGFQGIFLALHLGKIHVIFIVVKMPRPLPEVQLEDLGSYDKVVSPLEVLAPLKVLQYEAYEGPLGVIDDEPGPGLLMNAEEIELLPQAAVVPAFGLLQHRQVGIQLLLGGEGGA